MRIDITRLGDDLMSCKSWEFYFSEYLGAALVLDKYIEMSRATKRHKYKMDEHYSRLDERGSSLKEEEVTIPPDVAKEAHEKFCAEIKVVKWSDVKR